MNSVELVKALRDRLLADRDANGSSWPDASTSVKLDPRVYFWDEVSTPAVRLCLDPDGATREPLTNGGLTKVTEKVCLGFSLRVETEEQFADFLAWGQYLAKLLNDVAQVEDWTNNRPGEWAYTHDPQLFSTGAQSETIVGQMIGLFLTDWSTTR